MANQNGPPSWLVLRGSFIHSGNDRRLILMENKLLGLYDGKIQFLEDPVHFYRLQREFGFSDTSFNPLETNEFLIPGFVDTHIHAPQYVNFEGVGVKEPVLDWLRKYNYPFEADFKRLPFARSIFKKVVAKEEKQRAFVGKVNININSLDGYCETTKSSINDTQAFIDYVVGKNNPLVKPIISPRFALGCSEKLMKKLGVLARNNNLAIQTHISESKEEVRLVEAQFPRCSNYTDVYNKTGLLTEKTILAHGIHLSDEEIDLIKLKGSAIAHCPTSNINFNNGLCDVRRILDNEIPVGLGTDISGGCSLSMLDAIRQAVTTSTFIAMNKDSSYKPIDYEEAFFLATLGGSQVIGLENQIGTFEVGKDFDAIFVDPAASEGPIDCLCNDDLKTRFNRFIYLGKHQLL
ncbi:hypothetical protein CHUAL_006690 [Chamberlinius hualienensis]